jgi:hypothetical protein
MEIFLNLTVNSDVRNFRSSYTRLRKHLNVALAAEQRSRLPEVVKPLRESRERTRSFLNVLIQDVFELIVVLCCDFSNTTRSLDWQEV